MSNFWYPKRYSARIPLHANFSLNAQATGLTYNLVAAQQASIARDATNVANIVNYKEALAAHSLAVTEWADVILESPIGTPFPPSPTAPLLPTFAIGSEAAIRPRTLLYAGIIRAAPLFTVQVGDNYGIISAPEGPPGTPELDAEPLGGSLVRLDVDKAGYDSVAIDSRYVGEPWVEIGVCETAEFLDGRAPLVAGQPEVREFRAQGRQNNVRVGPISMIVTTVTIP